MINNKKMMKIEIEVASLKSKSVIQNMARFYVYELSKYCGDAPDWEFPEDGLYECRDLNQFWEKPDHYAYIVRVNSELAGFVLVDKNGTTPDIDWYMSEFFIVGKFQRRGVGDKVALNIFKKFPGTWEVAQMLRNSPAIHFWRSVIGKFTGGKFSEMHKVVPSAGHTVMNVQKFESPH